MAILLNITRPADSTSLGIRTETLLVNPEKENVARFSGTNRLDLKGEDLQCSAIEWLTVSRGGVVTIKPKDLKSFTGSKGWMHRAVRIAENNDYPEFSRFKVTEGIETVKFTVEKLGKVNNGVIIAAPDGYNISIIWE